MAEEASEPRVPREGGAGGAGGLWSSAMSRSSLVVPALLLALVVSLGACAPADPLEEARTLVASRDIEGGLRVLRAYLEESPDDPEANYMHGVLLSMQGQPTLATWSLRKAMEHEEWRARAGMQLADGALVTDQHDAALEVLNELLEAEPDHAEVLLLRCRAHYESRRGYAEALADAERVLELDPDRREALVWKAINLLSLERTEEAETILDELEQRYAEADAPLQQTQFFCVARASFAAANDQPELADERFRECLAVAPSHGTVVREAVEFHEERGETERVIEIYRAAHAVDPVTGGYRQLLARALLHTGEKDEAEALLLEATELPSLHVAVNAWMDLATIYRDREDYAAAASAVKGAIDRTEAAGAPVAPLLRFNYADMLLLSDRYAEAEAVAREIEVPQFRAYVEARARLAAGDPEAALEKFSTVLSLWPNNASSRYYAAIAHEEAGDFDAAIESYRYAIRAGPDETDARLRLGQLLTAKGDYPRARAAMAAGGGRYGMGNEIGLEVLRAAGRLARSEEIRRLLAQYRGKPAAMPALIAVTEGLHDRSGPEAALGMLNTSVAETTHPGAAPVLRAKVLYLIELDRSDEAVALAAAAAKAHPEFAPFHEIHARALAGAGSPEAEAAYQRAAEGAPDSARILEGQGQLAARGGDVDAALALYARAAAADEEWALPERAAAELLLAQGREAEAEERLAAVIERDPYDPWAPMRLAELLLERGGEPARSLALARRASYFGGGEEAERLLAEATAGHS